VFFSGGLAGFKRRIVAAGLAKVVLVVGSAGLVAGLAGGGVPAMARDARPAAPAAVSGTVAVAALPPEAQATHRLIHTGGPFPYPKDGSVFGNRERQLPAERRGYYREYTVATPGARNRAARRIVCGGLQVTAPQACYYTDDHYASFRRIVQ